MLVKINSIIIFITYQIIQLIALPLLPIYLIIRKIKRKPVFGNLQERIGLVPINKSIKNTIWIHAVSVGEILSIQNLIDQIKEKNPNSCCYVTTGTITGKKIAKKNLNCDYISFLPYDFLLPMFLAFKRIKPSSLIIIEAETWPNLLFIAKWLDIPMYMINARISKRSEKKYFQLKFLFKNLLEKFKLILTQSEHDTKLFQNLGISKQKIKTLGNIKTLNVFIKKNKLITTNTKSEYKVLLLGCIHPGELDIYIDLYTKLKSEFQNLKLIIAPRHFHWKKELITKIKKTNYPFYLWENETQLQKEKNDSIALTNKIFKTSKETFNVNDILLICKLGELFNIYQTADIYFLGGTFVPVGGHNLLEPAAWSKPSIIGPHYQNTKDIADKLEQKNGLIKIKSAKPDKEELYTKTKKLLLNDNLRIKMGENSHDWLETEADKIQIIIDNFLNILKQKSQY